MNDTHTLKFEHECIPTVRRNVYRPRKKTDRTPKNEALDDLEFVASEDEIYCMGGD
jgi:hypothetical protein